MRILTVIGARPQFIKAAPVSRALRDAGVDEVLVHTGQHFDDNMSSVFFRELGLPAPAVNLDVHGGGHGEQTGRMLIALEPVVEAWAPDVLLVYGDTNSTLAGALVASKLHIPVAHVEAGLRSFDRTMPEEINRVVTDHLASWQFAPTSVAVENLAAEGIREQVHLVGDVMYDAALMFATAGESHEGGHVLMTIHRASSTDDPETLQAIVTAAARLAAEGLHVIWPIHPRTRGLLERFGIGSLAEPIDLRAPVGYGEMTALTRSAAVVLTDSGGLQKEAYFHRVPCVTARTSTEWTELVELGWNRLVDPADSAAIVSAVTAAVGSRGVDDTQPYGDGRAAVRIAQVLRDT